MKGQVTCSCGKTFESLVEWSTHYRHVAPKVKSHTELARSELSKHIQRSLQDHSKHHRPLKT